MIEMKDTSSYDFKPNKMISVLSRLTLKDSALTIFVICLYNSTEVLRTSEAEYHLHKGGRTLHISQK